MPTYVPNGAEVVLLNALFKDASVLSLTLHLYKNDYTPSETTVLGDLTEADFTGYSSKTITRADWDTATSITGEAVIEYSNPFIFESESTQTVYGYFLKTGSTLVYVEKFPIARNLDNGSSLSLTPKISLSNKDA